MKKSLLALAVAALSAATLASTASATTVYDKDGTTLGFHGRVQSVLYSGKASGVTDEKASINTSGRLGIDLRTQLTPSVAGFAMAEWELANGNNSADESSGFINRLMWVGLDFGKAGSVKFGKFEEAIKYSLFATDVFDDYGGYGYSGNDDRREGVVMYQWSGNGFDALVSYAFAKDNEHLDGTYENGVPNGNPSENVNLEYSVSAAIGYTSPDVVFGPIAVRAGFATGSMNNPTNSTNTTNVIQTNYSGTDATVANGHYDSYTSYALGVSWGKTSIGPYVGAQFSQRKLDANGFTITETGKTPYETSLDAKVTGYEFALGYAFSNGVQVRTGYQTQKYENFGGDSAKSATVPVYVNWNLNPQVQVWAEARFDAGTDDKNDGKNFEDLTHVYGNLADNVFSAGIRYSF